MTIDGMPANVAMSFPPMGGYGGFGGAYGCDWWAIILLAFLFGGFGGGYGGFGGSNGALGMGAVYGAQQFSQLDNGIRSLQSGLADGFYAVNTNALQGQNQLARDLCTGFSAVNSAIAENRFASQNCCCETQRAIEGVKYANAEYTCSIINC